MTFSSEERTNLLLTLEKLKGQLEKFEPRTSVHDPCQPYRPAPSTHVCTGLAGALPRVKSPIVPRVKAPKLVACFTKTYKVYSIEQAQLLGLGPLAPVALISDPNSLFRRPKTESKLFTSLKSRCLSLSSHVATSTFTPNMC